MGSPAAWYRTFRIHHSQHEFRKTVNWQTLGYIDPLGGGL
jgi:hypothetical protein